MLDRVLRCASLAVLLAPAAAASAAALPGEARAPQSAHDEPDNLGCGPEVRWSFAQYPPALGDYEIQFDRHVFRSGNASLSIRSVKKDNAVSWGGAFTAKNVAVKENANYRLTVYAKANDAGRVELACHFSGQKGKVVENYALDKGTYDWTPHEFHFRTPEGTNQVRLYFQSRGRGCVWLDDVRVEELPPQESQTLTHDKRTYLYDPRYEKSDPPLATQLRKQHESDGYVVYVRNDLRTFYPTSIPQPEEVARELSTSACPGQYASAWLMVYAIRPVKALAVAPAGDWAGPEQGTLRKEGLRIKHVKCWEKPYSTLFGSHRYYVIPELLENPSQTDVAPGTSEGFWLQVKIPADASPGRYTGELLLSTDDRPAKIRWHIDVLPFRLEKPQDVHWMMYSDLSLRYGSDGLPESHPYYHRYSDAELRRYLADMVDYGITSIWDMPYGNLEYAAKTARLVKEAGFSGPLVLHSYPEAPAMQKRNIKWNALSVFPEMNDAALQQDVVARLREMDGLVKAAGIPQWYFQGFGEMGSDTGQTIERALWSAQLAGRADVKLYITVYPFHALVRLLPHVPGAIDANSFLARDAELCACYREACARHQVEPWLVGGGIYTGQEGGMMPDRYLSGFLLFKTGVKGHISWTYQRLRGSRQLFPWRFPCIAYPAPKISDTEVVTSTLQWEGIREGIDDYRYAYTLTQWIKRAKDKGLAQEAATAQKTLDGLIEAVPWAGDYQVGNCHLKPGNFCDADATRCRRQITQEISRLKAIVEH